MLHIQQRALVAAVRFRFSLIVLTGIIASFIPFSASAAVLNINDQYSHATQYYFPIGAKSWSIPDGSMFTGFSGEFFTKTATNDFNIALMRIHQTPKGAGNVCPPTNSWWINYQGDWSALANAFPGPDIFLGNSILKRPNAGEVHQPLNYDLPAGYGVPIDGCVWAMLNGSALIAGGAYTMGANLQMKYETGAAAAVLTPLRTIVIDDEECYGLNGCGPFHTYDNTLQFMKVVKPASDVVIRALHGNSGHSTLQAGPMANWFGGSQAQGPWTVTDDFYVLPECSAFTAGNKTADNWEAKLPASKQKFYTRTLGSTGVDVKQDPINQTFTTPVKVPATGCIIHLVKRTGSGSIDTETQVVAYLQDAFDAKIISQSVPATMEAGKTYPITITVRNDGFETWTAATNDRLGTVGDNVWGVARVNVPVSVQSRGTATFTFNVKATTTPGTYKFQWRMLREGVRWFGAKTPEVSVKVSATPTPAAPVVTLTANPASVVSGSASTLTWTSTNATSCTASGVWTGAKVLNGSQSTGAITATQTYTLTCTGAGGSTAKSVTVTVTAAPIANNAQFVSQSIPTMLQTGQTYNATVTFKNTGTATWTTATSYKLGSQNPQDNTIWGAARWTLPQSVAPGASVTIPVSLKAPAVAGSYNFQVQMLREGVQWFGTKSTNVAIQVSKPAAPVVTLTANPTSVVVGSAATLTWSAVNAVACTASGAWSGAKALNGTQSTGPLTAAQTYTLSCSGSGGTTVKSVTVNVVPKPTVPTLTLTAVPTTVVVGGSTKLTWAATNATSCLASGNWAGGKEVSGSQDIPLDVAGLKTFTLTCAGAGGSTAKSVTVTVTPQSGTCGAGAAWNDDGCVATPIIGEGNPTGFFDGLLTGTAAPTLYGWAYDPKASAASVAVHIYVDGPASYVNNYGNFAASVVANTSRPDVNAALHITGNHGWQWVIPEKYRTGAHTFYVYAINLRSGGANPQLSNSPRTIRVTAGGNVLGEQKSSCWALPVLTIDTLMECFGY